MITVSAAVVDPQVPGVSCRRSASGSAHRRLSCSTPPSDAADGNSVTRNVELAVYGYWSPRTSTPASRARWSMSSNSPLFPLFSDPNALQCEICTRAPERRPISIASSSASPSRSPSSRMWVAYGRRHRAAIRASVTISSVCAYVAGT